MDRLDGLGGNDDLRGGAGNDDLYGGAGRDSLRGDAGNDALRFLDGFSLADLQFDQVGDDAVIRFTGNDDMSVRLSDTESDSLRSYTVTDEGGNEAVVVAIDSGAV